jgi:hypothetical protein
MDREVVAKLLFLAGMAFVLVVTIIPILFVLAVMAEGD